MLMRILINGTLFFFVLLSSFSLPAQPRIRIDVNEVRFKGTPLLAPETLTIKFRDGRNSETIKLHEHEGVEYMLDIAYKHTRDKLIVSRKHYLLDKQGRNFRGLQFKDRVKLTAATDSIYGRSNSFVFVDEETDEKYELWYHFVFVEE